MFSGNAIPHRLSQYKHSFHTSALAMFLVPTTVAVLKMM
jgi:hypothetical protein